MDYFGPHPSSAFEGYYSKFFLPSGAHLALIICMVRNAKRRPYMVSVTYVAQDSKRHWQREYWPDVIEFNETGTDSFDMNVPGIGSVQCTTEKETYDLKTSDFEIHGETVKGTRQPWIAGDSDSTPAGLLVHAPLPIQWHVHTLCSEVTFSLNFISKSDELSLAPQDAKGQCTVHHEKNWAKSFPAKYIWVQSWDPETSRGICIAGGEALPGVEAYLLTYTDRLTGQSWTFTPPWTFGVLEYSPFCTTSHEYRNGRLSLDVSNLTQRIVVHSSAPKDTFFQLSAPLPEGHRSNFACESFAATNDVKVYTRNWPWQPWTLVRQDTFEYGSLEFGGGYYDDAGKKMV